MRSQSNIPSHLLLEDIVISAPVSSEFTSILTPDAMRFIAKLSTEFSGRREALLQRRVGVQARIDAGLLPDFLPETQHIRNADWKIAATPSDLQDRRVEITGPAGDTKMVINALNSGANVFMADFEDAQSPTWENTIRGQINLHGALTGTISYLSPEGKTYKLNDRVATLMVRPRGWHLLEKHVLIYGKPISASLFDFGLFIFHNIHTLLRTGKGPYFYLPKLENHLEALLWNDVFVFTELELQIPRGKIKATVLIETILAAFEMDEILYELREHSAGLNCGRWDYIFSFIKKFRGHPRFLLPNRAQITMDKGFLSSYVNLLVKTCHRRGAHAMGGMAAQIPIKNDETANAIAFAKVRADKEREVRAGHDGTWVAHPGLVQVAKAIFNEGMLSQNQLHVVREDVTVNAQDLLNAPAGEITESGLRTNIEIGIQYIEAWLQGSGAVPLYNLMEDAATAEISRAQVWQWRHHRARLSDGRIISKELIHQFQSEELSKIESMVGTSRFSSGRFQEATELFESLVMADEFVEFLTVSAYKYIN
jgi:malate synthase